MKFEILYHTGQVNIFSESLYTVVMPQDQTRRSIRLPGFDYSAPGAYFITIKVQSREPLLGKCTDQGVQLNDFGRIVADAWKLTQSHFSIELDEFVIMPDHFHALVWIVDNGNEPNKPQKDNWKIRGTQPQSLQALVQNFKSVTANRINQIRKSPGMRVWQRNYYEHVVRDEQDLENIRQYIRENPFREDS